MFYFRTENGIDLYTPVEFHTLRSFMNKQHQKVIAAIIWIIIFVMVLGVIELDISPLLATLGVASLGLGFAIQDIIRDYTKPGEQWGLIGELRKRIKNRFDQEGIEILWPHSKIYFGNTLEIATDSVC